ncbi:hypothetical protein GCM10009674_17250 [Nesterenkonia xinjiangensis]
MHPTITAKMGPNGVVGYRFGVIAANDDTWEAAHRASWPLLRACLLLAVVGSTVVLLIQLLGDDEYLGHVAALQACGFLVVGTIGGMIKATNAAQDCLAELESPSSSGAAD